MIDNLIPLNSKFVAIAFDGATSDLSEVLAVAEGIFFCPNAPFEIDPQWRQWIGTLRAGEIEKANLVLLASSPSANPQVLDNENQDLERTVLKLWYSVLILGVPAYRGSNVVSGGKVGEEVQIRQVSRLPTFYYDAESMPLRFRSESAREAGWIFGVINRVYDDPKSVLQLRRGLKSFQRALAEELDYDRLHGFVRSLDAIVMTEKSKGRRNFIKRCKLFVRTDSNTEATLGLMYDLRSRVEHQADWDDLFPGANESERLCQANQITRQAEVLARTVYHVILRDESLFSLFGRSEVIRALWASDDFSHLSVPEEKKVDLCAIPPSARSQFL
ncbi:MAG: hypothetical protein AB1555_19105 [Nitrospirota bacterium]